MSDTLMDGSEDVNDFLLRIRELGEKRDSEDEERTRKLEQEILQGRKERQARRAERARSISPTKSSPATTPVNARMTAVSTSTPESSSPKDDSQTHTKLQRDMGVEDALERLTGTNAQENISPSDTEHKAADSVTTSSISNNASAAMPSRTPTLSWQRRPVSQASERPKSRPLSMVATENAARTPRGNPVPAASSDSPKPTISRDQIAQRLASKSPDWFKQTADRGTNSPAFRRHQVEDEIRSDHSSASPRVPMPGMSQGTSHHEQAIQERMESSIRPLHTASDYKTNSKVSNDIGSSIPETSAHIFDPPGEAKAEGRNLAMLPAQGRISPDRHDRPISPTKGMGGFVQSAMMKRSDSVNKRWTVQSPTGLSRGNSVVSHRSSHEIIGTTGSAGKDFKASSLSRENSPRPELRPDSRQSNTNFTQERLGTANSMQSSITTSTQNNFAKPQLPASRSQTPLGSKSDQLAEPIKSATQIERSPPTTPSKTMDPRRWSPTKSSWLESALNKPESPKPKTAPPPQQPTWMSEIAKAKQKTSVDLGRSPTNGPKHEVSIGGLLRSPPMGGYARPPSLDKEASVFSRPSQKESVKPAVLEERKGSIDSHSSPTVGALPSSSKPKPETPPKKDFRATLKSRQLPPETDSSNQPEFKNVFGQLRRTKTQNYVAPDELKDNITRGKAALNTTGGPKKTERKDEFREAILKKKEDFKQAQLEGKGVTRSASVSQGSPLPEALAKRKALGRSDSTSANSETGGVEPPARCVTERPTTPSLPRESTAPGRLQGKDSVVTKLMGRMNPDLAGLLARGPPSSSSEASRNRTPSVSQRTVNKNEATLGATETGPQLTHMTKARARGPRRKAPSNVHAPSASNAAATIEDGVTTPDNVVQEAAANKISSCISASPSEENEKTVPQPSSPRKLDLKRRSQFLQEPPDRNDKLEAPSTSSKPLTSTKLTDRSDPPGKYQGSSTGVHARRLSLSNSTSTSSSNQVDSMHPALKSRTDPSATTKPGPAALSIIKPSIAVPTTVLPMDAEKSSSLSSIKASASQWENNGPKIMPLRVKSPIKLPTDDDGKSAMTNSGFRSASPDKESPALSPTKKTSSTSARPLPASPAKDSLLVSTSTGLRSPAKIKTIASPTSQTFEASNLLDKFFGDRRASRDFQFDTVSLLSARPNQDLDIKTLRSNLYQVTGDGKKQQVPSHQERILFEGNIYIVSHVFGDSAGKRISEVYLWYGDGVSDSALRNATVSAESEAKSLSSKLIFIRQGKETPEFFNAMGGIVISRRGSSNKYDSLAPHILCGRKHHGHMAFDEVDFSPKSLCSGYPYLISTPSGKCFLWKGKGSGIEELSCARLIGMDSGLTGEIQEVEDGQEPQSFLDIFGKGSQVLKSADHWRMKPNYNKHCVRLFVADADASGQIQEISPFCQADLSKENVYILDAFFEMYIIVGASARAQYSAFHNALLFAQEYGILAAGMEDRPFVPVTTVVLEGVPRDMKAVFRKWVDELSPTNHDATPSATGTANGSGLQRGRSLRVLPLSVALEATRS